MRAENPHSEGESFQETDYQRKSLDDIISTQLSVENIDTYADDALRELIAFTDKKVADYRTINLNQGLSDKEIEDRAFKYYGIENVSLLLDHISNKAIEIHRLDVIVDGVEIIDQVVVKPDETSPRMHTLHKSEYQEKRNIDRLKTVLFILGENFGVDVFDSSQLTIQKESLNDDMLRKNSYYFLQIPSIDRIILTCDEVGNITYVFNSKELRRRNIEDRQIIGLTKSELNQLIKSDPEIGRSVVYSKNGFVPRIIAAIEKPISIVPDEVLPRMEDAARYFVPRLPKGFLSIRSMAKELGMGVKTIERIISEIDPDQFGEISRYAIGPSVTNGYSLEQTEMIIEQIEKKGYWDVPENCLSANGIAEELGLSRQTINKIIGEIDPKQLGEIGKYLMGTHVVNGYSSEQVKIIKQKIVEKGYLRKKPENYVSTKGMSKKLNLTPRTINKIIGEIDPKQLGEIGKYLMGTHVVSGYSPEQQKIIGDYIDSHK